MKYLFLMLLLPTAWADTLTLKVTPAKRGLDWSTPKTFLSSALWSSLDLEKYPFGHTFVELSCAQKTLHLSQEMKNNDSLRQLLLAGSGLGLLFHSFDGELKTGDEVLELEKDRSFEKLTFKLNSHQCQRVLKYIEAFQKHNVGRHYGPALRPLYGEGGSGSNFAASLLEVLGLMDMDLKIAWTRVINVPLDQSGPPLRDEGVNILKVYFFADRWSTEREPHRKLHFYDPTKIIDWIKVQKSALIDKSYLPAPKGDFWLQLSDPMYQH